MPEQCGADVDGICTGMHADVAEARAEVERLRVARDTYRDELSKIADFEEWDLTVWESLVPVRTLVTDVRPHAATERDRYRLAWLSARRRAADEANMGMEALELKNQEITRLRSLIDERKTFCAPRLECVGPDGEGGEVYRLADDR